MMKVLCHVMVWVVCGAIATPLMADDEAPNRKEAAESVQKESPEVIVKAEAKKTSDRDDKAKVQKGEMEKPRDAGPADATAQKARNDEAVETPPTRDPAPSSLEQRLRRVIRSVPEVINRIDQETRKDRPSPEALRNAFQEGEERARVLESVGRKDLADRLRQQLVAMQQRLRAAAPQRQSDPDMPRQGQRPTEQPDPSRPRVFIETPDGPKTMHVVPHGMEPPTPQIHRPEARPPRGPHPEEMPPHERVRIRRETAQLLREACERMDILGMPDPAHELRKMVDRLTDEANEIERHHRGGPHGQPVSHQERLLQEIRDQLEGLREEIRGLREQMQRPRTPSGAGFF